jgi:hypothetical protein
MRLIRWRRPSSLVVPFAVAVGVSALYALALAGSAAAATPCGTNGGFSQSGTTATCTYTGANKYTFTVPSGVSSLDVIAVGADGGAGIFGGAGGAGASVEDTAVPVGAYQNQALSVVVGGVGGPATGDFFSGTVNGGAGGTPGGGGAGGDYPSGDPNAEADGGGGGGYSGLFNPSSSPLVIAAGGGGGGGGVGLLGVPNGGAGDTGSGGGMGAPAPTGNPTFTCGLNNNDGCGGDGGTSSGGGTGAAGSLSSQTGQNGKSLIGGAGGLSFSDPVFNKESGGGGGGGYFGGGGGGGGESEGSGGGGGGSSFGISGLTHGMTATGAASVAISYTVSTSALAATLVDDSTGVGPGKALFEKASAIQTAVNANPPQIATACAGITDYLGLVKAQTGKKLTQAQANQLTTDANNLAAALGC